MKTIYTAEPTVLAPEAIATLPSVSLGGIPGVEHRVMWRSEDSMAGVMTITAGHHLGAHTHRENHHHMWVLEGHATILGELVGPGSYVHVPSGVEHDIDATTTEGCTLVYLYIRVAS